MTAGLKRVSSGREKEMIEAALAERRGQVAGPKGAAAKLGIPRQTPDSGIASLGTDKHRFKAPYGSLNPLSSDSTRALQLSDIMFRDRFSCAAGKRWAAYRGFIRHQRGPGNTGRRRAS
jgi:hypothetical protein